MNSTAFASTSKITGTINLRQLSVLYARIALGCAFLSAVASRFGLWDRHIDMKHFANFVQYTAEVNSFMPASTIPFLAWMATVAETSLGIALILGVWPRQVAFAAAILLTIFGTAMAVFLRAQVTHGLFRLLRVSCGSFALHPAAQINPK